MDLSNLSLVPRDYKKKDPRTLPYLYPETLNIVAYAKKVQAFSYYQTLEVAEDLARRNGFLLLPYSCMHWQRAKNYGVDRKVKIGRKSFFMLRPHELTKGELNKLRDYLIEEVGHEPDIS
ncbi:hypothetical protein SAMN04488134_11346 [Amphibacillus marinus]|uniref:Uncharacterized protein n=1 Tax=Amphibacillus marinus TaxID=872970 RepID=A0A1H8SNZ9_9BACI|nr:hypothetical protein [Amphibacillus marinus]SEO80038.1 hypothetical protein SAMN04488134_11346 [Amphibacillus marinus]